jgi:aldose 1-epimerase
MARYQVDTETREGRTLCQLRDTRRRAEALLYPELGNNCVAFRTTPDPDGRLADGTECAPVDLFVPPDNLEDLRRSPFHAGQPILFPFPNRVRDGRYTFEGKTYTMPDLLAKGWDKGAGHAIHGLVGDKAWTLEAAHADDHCAQVRCFLQMDAISENFAQYPFPCRIIVTYRLREGILEMQTEVINTGTQTLPMGFGIHPWFPTALRPGATLPDTLAQIDPERRALARVRVPAAAIWELEKLMPTGRVIPVTDLEPHFDLSGFRALGQNFYDNVFTRILHRADGWSEAGLRDPQTHLELYLAADGSFREWVLYAPQTRPVIALEPYTCPTDAINLYARGLDVGLIRLAAGESWTGTIRFGLRAW